MKLKVWGTRGSYPVCRPNVMRYGGNTTCLELWTADDHVVIDGGSGIAPLGRELIVTAGGPMHLNLMLTHPHWDHVLGYPYFQPFYDPRFTIDIYGADSENKTLEAIFSTQHQAGNFPIGFDDLESSLKLNQLQPEQIVNLNTMQVRTIQLNHPGMDLGYRFEANGASVVFLTDLAPIEDNHLGVGMAEKAADNAKALEQDYYSALVEFVRGADLVLHDTNFTEEEIVGKRHWGHSTPQMAIQLLSELDAPPPLVLTHHDPDHSDEMMDEIYEQAKRDGKHDRVDVLIAKEGEVFEL